VAPFVPIADGAQVEIGFDLDSTKHFENRLWFVSRQPPIDLTQLQALADGVASWHTSEVLPWLSVDLTVLSVLAVRWTTAPGDIFAQSFVNLSGGDSNPSHSAKVAIKVNFRWPFNYRLKENANYVAGIPKSEVSINRFLPSIRSRLFDAYADLIDLAAVFGPFPAWRWVAASAWEAGALRSEQFARSVEGPAFRSDILATRRTRNPV